MKLTPANSTRTSASPSPGKPPAAFSTERTSGPPNLDTLTTRTCSHPFLPLIAPRPRLLAPDCQRKSAPPIADKRHPWVSTSRNRHERQLEDDLQVIISVVWPTAKPSPCLLYTSDAADDLLCVDLGGRRIIN